MESGGNHRQVLDLCLDHNIVKLREPRQDVGEPQSVLQIEFFMDVRLADVAVDQKDFLSGVGQQNRERGAERGFSVPGKRTGTHHHLRIIPARVEEDARSDRTVNFVLRGIGEVVGDKRRVRHPRFVSGTDFREGFLRNTKRGKLGNDLRVERVDDIFRRAERRVGHVREKRQREPARQTKQNPGQGIFQKVRRNRLKLLVRRRDDLDLIPSVVARQDDVVKLSVKLKIELALRINRKAHGLDLLTVGRNRSNLDFLRGDILLDFFLLPVKRLDSFIENIDIRDEERLVTEDPDLIDRSAALFDSRLLLTVFHQIFVSLAQRDDTRVFVPDVLFFELGDLHHHVRRLLNVELEKLFIEGVLHLPPLNQQGQGIEVLLHPGAGCRLFAGAEDRDDLGVGKFGDVASVDEPIDDIEPIPIFDLLNLDMNQGRFKALESRQKGVVRQVPDKMNPGIPNESGKLVRRLLNLAVEFVPSLLDRLANDVGRLLVLASEIRLELSDQLAEHDIRLARRLAGEGDLKDVRLFDIPFPAEFDRKML